MLLQIQTEETNGLTFDLLIKNVILQRGSAGLGPKLSVVHRYILDLISIHAIISTSPQLSFHNAESAA